MSLHPVPSTDTLKALETAPNMYLVLSPDLYILTASNLFLQATETIRETITGRHIFEAFPDNPDFPDGDGVQNINASLQEVLRTKQPHYMRVQRYDVPDRNNPGKFIPRYWDPSHTPVLNEQNEIAYIIQLATNVTEKVLAEQALVVSKREQQHALEEIQELNEELMASDEEIKYANLELQQNQDNLQQLNVELETRVSLGTTELASSNNQLLETNQQQLSLFEQLKRAQQDLKRQRDTLNRFFLQVPAGICVLDGPQHTYELVNTEYQKLFPGRHLLGLQVVEALPELKGSIIEDTLNKVFTTGETYEANALLVPLAYTPDGPIEDRYFNFVYQAKLNTDNQVDGILVLVYEVTEQTIQQKEIQELNEELSASNEELLQTQELLIQSTEELASTVETLRIATESASVGTWSMSPDGEWLITPEVKRIFGLTHADSLTYPEALAQVRPDYIPYVSESVDASLAKGEQFNIEYPIIDKINGKERWIRSVGKLMEEYGPKKGFLYGALIDVTDQVNARHAVEESEARFRTMAEGTDVMIAIGDETGAAVYFNEAWAEMTGRSVAELMKFGWVNLIHPDDKEHVTKTFKEAFDKQESWEWEFRLPNRQGKYLWLLARGKARIGLDGVFAGYISSTIDITARKEDEQRKNDFIGMVSHELKTPLTSLSAYLQMLQGRARKADDLFTLGALDKSVNQTKKMTTMINGFLNVSRLESGKIHIDRSRFDMAELLKEVEEESVATVTSHQVVFAPVEETYVIADRDKIGQIVNNFISNAVKYSPLGSTINVACETVGNHTQLNVKDKGLGIKIEDQHKLFDRYYRVESNAGHIAGFGIGLYLCAEIIQRHEGGKIWVESEVGKGSTFKFSIPIER